jgi:hypothetical protein
VDDRIQGDRRIQRRYPLELDLEYKIIEHGVVVSTGEGKTVNISSGGVLFQTGKGVPGGLIALSIRWPAVLGNLPFIELWISGRIVRSDTEGTAVRMERYEFQKLENPAQEFYQLFGNCLVH